MTVKKRTIKKDDYTRVLKTETLPDETPIIFSNEGLYQNCKNSGSVDSVLQMLLDHLIFPTASDKWQIPYMYKVRKDQLDFRPLSLIHPKSQWEIKKLYEQYSETILYLCSFSEFSIRLPYKIGSYFYEKNSDTTINRYKDARIAGLQHDSERQYRPLFFAYKRYDRVYKFYDSMEFCDLEKKFKYLWKMDVSKCFDSIYTHTISWATKNKEYMKENVKVKSAFGPHFDKIMQYANRGETNGIVIGPEASRIFAEILFQAIDKIALGKIEGSSASLCHEKDYAIRRYVDDIFVFTNREDDAKLIYQIYSDALAQYNMRYNNQKTLRFSRPFITDKTRAIREASRRAEAFIKSFCSFDAASETLIPGDIKRPSNLAQSFIASCREMSTVFYRDINSKDSTGFDEIASYLISLLVERVKKIIYIDSTLKTDKEKQQYCRALQVILDVLFFLYSVSPAVNSSYRLSTAMILIARFADKHLGNFALIIKQAIYDLTETLMSSKNISKSPTEGAICLEAINIVLAASELGDAYLLPAEKISELFESNVQKNNQESTCSYFEIVSCLYYIKDHRKYQELRARIINEIREKLKSVKDLDTNSEKVLLFLDILACPYVEQATREALLQKYIKLLGKPPLDRNELDVLFAADTQKFWFVRWKNVDLLNSLQERELRKTY